MASRIETRIQAVATKLLEGIDRKQAAVEKAQGAVTSRVNESVNILIAECKAQGLTGKTIVQAIDALFLLPCQQRGALSPSARSNYKTGVDRAVTLNCEFTASLFADPKAKVAMEAIRGKTGQGRAADARKAKSPGASTGAKVTQVSASAASAKPEVLGRRVTVVAPDSADLAMIAPMLADIVSQPARLALFCDWYKSTFSK